MKKMLTPRRLIIMLTGMLFAAYAAYNVFIIFRDQKALPFEGFFISALVAVLFSVLAVFAWTFRVKNIQVVIVRKMVFITVLIAVLVLKLRMASRVFEYLDLKKLHTVLYGAAYLTTVAGLVILLIYYAVILQNMAIYPRASWILPLCAMILFLISLALEAVLFFVYGIGLEANPLRTLVIRPVFYLAFVGLCLYFILPAQTETELEIPVEPSFPGIEIWNNPVTYIDDEDEYEDEYEALGDEQPAEETK